MSVNPGRIGVGRVDEVATGRSIGVDPEEVVDTALADLPGVDAKALLDAGTLPVTELYADEKVALMREVARVRDEPVPAGLRGGKPRKKRAPKKTETPS